jgi:hypothetical protein
VDGAHLVGDRTDPADARGDVGRLGERTPAQEGFEEARRLEQLQLDVGDLVELELDEERSFALDPGEVVDLDGSPLARAAPLG